MDIVRKIDDLTREVWTFYLVAVGGGHDARIRVVFTRYQRETRPSKRHQKWTVDAWWHDPKTRGANAGERLATAPRLSDDDIKLCLYQRMDVLWPEGPCPG